MTDLVQHVDDWVGFALRRPPGWEVRVTNGIISVVQDPSGLVNAIIWPLLLPQPLPPLEIARQLISLWSSGKRTVRAWRAGDEPLVLRTEFQQGGRLLSGLYSITAQQGTGLIAGFETPHEQAEAMWSPRSSRYPACRASSFETRARVPSRPCTRRDGASMAE